MIFIFFFLILDPMTESIAPPDTGVFTDQERPKRIFKIIVIGDSHVGTMCTEYIASMLIDFF